MQQKVYDIKNKSVDLFLLGDDYKDIFPKMAEYKQIVDMNCEIVFLPRTPDISTTEIKRKIAIQNDLDQKEDTIYKATKT